MTTPKIKHNPHTAVIGMFLWKSYSKDLHNSSSGDIELTGVENVVDTLTDLTGSVDMLDGVLALIMYVIVRTACETFANGKEVALGAFVIFILLLRIALENKMGYFTASSQCHCRAELEFKWG